MATQPVCSIISYDHGGLVLWGYDHFLHHLRDLIGWLSRHPRLKMGLDNEAWVYDWLHENQPSVLHELRDDLARYAGRLGIASCTYGQPLAAFILEESNIRQIREGIRAVRERLGYEISIYSWSEHAAFAQLPQILAQLGLRGVMMRTHYLMYGCCPGYDLPIALWQGPDGSRIACIPSYIHQERQVANHRAHPEGPYGLTTQDTWILTRYPSNESPDPMDAFVRRFAHVKPVVASRIDDSGLKREALVTELDTRDDMQWATLEDAFASLPVPTQVISPASEDFGVRMPWGYRGNELFDLARSAEIAALTAERLQVCVAGEGIDVDGLCPSLLLAWKDLLVGQHHDIQIVGRAGTMGRERLHASIQRSTDLTRELIGLCADAPQVPASFVVFNPLPWPREDLPELPDGTMLQSPARVGGLSMANTTQNAIDALAASPLPGLDFATAHYRVRFGEKGGIEALEDLAGERLLGANSGRPAGVVEGAASEGIATTRPAIYAEPWGYRVEERGQIAGMPYSVSWRFFNASPRIDYSLSVRFNGETIGEPTTRKNDSRSCFVHEQKLRARFYPAVDPSAACGIYDVPFGQSTTSKPYVEGNYWTAIADERAGLLIANRGTMGSCREADGAFSVPLAFSTDYIWGKEAICGMRCWRLGLLPFRGHWQDRSLHRAALEFAFPLVATPGTLRSPIAEQWHNRNVSVHLTALYRESGRTYLRLFNGSDVAQTLTLPAGGYLVDLVHRTLGPVDATLTLKPWQIVTICGE